LSTYVSYSEINSLEEFSFIAGTTYDITVNVYEEDGITPLDMTGATINWVVAPFGRPNLNILEKAVTITDIGILDFTIESVDTENLSGKYVHQLVITAFSGSKYKPGQGVILIMPQIPEN